MKKTIPTSASLVGKCGISLRKISLSHLNPEEVAMHNNNNNNLTGTFRVISTRGFINFKKFHFVF